MTQFRKAVVASVCASALVFAPVQVGLGPAASAVSADVVADGERLGSKEIAKLGEPDGAEQSPAEQRAAEDARSSEGGSSAERKTVGDSNLTAGEIAAIVVAVVVLAPPILIHIFYAMI